MITIKEKSENLSKIDLYKLTQSPELQVVKNLMDGEMIKVGGYCYYEDVKDYLVSFTLRYSRSEIE